MKDEQNPPLEFVGFDTLSGKILVCGKQADGKHIRIDLPLSEVEYLIVAQRHLERMRFRTA